jgi:hypothetical protein
MENLGPLMWLDTGLSSLGVGQEASPFPTRRLTKRLPA